MYKIITLVAIAFIFCGCESITGNGNIVTELRKVNRFDGIRTKGSIDVEIINGTDQTVKVEADENVLPYIITKVDEGLLDVHYKSGKSFRNVDAKVFVSSDVLDRLTVSGSGGIVSRDTIKSADIIEIKIGGSGDISVVADAPSITAAISGSGTITLAGRTKDFKGNITGSGDLKCSSLLCENATVKVTGSGTARVYASVHLIARVTGSGDIYYSGSPSSPDIKKTGSGTIQADK